MIKARKYRLFSRNGRAFVYKLQAADDHFQAFANFFLHFDRQAFSFWPMWGTPTTRI